MRDRGCQQAAAGSPPRLQAMFSVLRSWLVLTSSATIVLVASIAPAPAQAQLLHLDPLPFFTPADSTSRLALVVDVDRFADAKFNWSLNRILLTAVLPAGDSGAFFLRLPHLTFDTGETPVSARWPWALAPEVEPGWPNEKRISSFGKIEVGVTGPMRLPALGGVDYGLALGLPTGSDRVFPFAAQSIPMRVQLRKPLKIRAGLQAGLQAGCLVHLDSGKDFWDPFVFPNGYQLGATLAGYGRRGSRWQLSWDYRNEDRRKSQLVGMQTWLPWSADGAVGLKISREIQGSLDRPAEWYFTLSWRLDSPKYRSSANANANSADKSRSPATNGTRQPAPDQR